MTWVTILWSMNAAACCTLAAIYFVAWCRNRKAWVHLLFSLTAISVAAFAAFEWLEMGAQTTTEYGLLIRWAHVPLWVLAISLVWFVRFYLKGGRLWLAWTACGMRTLALILNFIFWPNLNYRRITSLEHLQLWGDEKVTIAVGVPNPWTIIGFLGIVPILLFLIDATVTAWRRGERQRAGVVGGASIFFVTVAATEVILLITGVIRAPYFVSFPYFGIVVAMAYELSSELFRAAQVSQQLQLSESALRESEQRFHMIANTAPVMIWMTGPDKSRTFFNKGWLDFTGRSLNQELGNGWMQGMHREDVDHFQEVYGRSFEARREFSVEYRLRRHDGEYCWILSTGVPRFGSDGIFLGYIGSSIDITPRVEAERGILKHREELAHMSRIALMGAMTASIAHELNQPLTGILTNARAGQRFIEDGKIDPEEFKELLGDIAAASRRAGDVIVGIRKLVKKETPNRQLISINQVVEDVTRLAKVDASLRGFELQSSLDSSEPAVRADRVQLQQVLLNLIVNAFDAMDNVNAARRCVVISTSRHGVNGTSVVRTSVRDFGNGLPDATDTHIFDQFFSTKRDGMGMGLAIARSIVESHGGVLVAENAEGGGAQFFFTLPQPEESSQ